MIFIANAQGTIVKSISSPVYRGQSNANEVLLLAPYSSTAEVYAEYQLPNGIMTKPIYLNQLEGVEEENLTDGDGNVYNAWYASVGAPVSEYVGTVTVQFFLVTEATTHATSTATFPVSGISDTVVTDTPSEESWEQVLAVLSGLDGAKLDITELQENKLDKVTPSEGTVLYAATPDAQTTLPLSETPTDGAIPVYQSFGKLTVNTDESDATCAACVGYVDAMIANATAPLSETVTTLNEVVRDLFLNANEVDEEIYNIQQEMQLHDSILRQVVVTETEMEDTFTSRTTACGREVIDGAETTMVSIKGNTLTARNYLSCPSTTTTGTASGVTITHNGDGSYAVQGTCTAACNPFLSIGSNGIAIGAGTYYFHARNTAKYDSVTVYLAKPGWAEEDYVQIGKLSAINAILSFELSEETSFVGMKLNFSNGAVGTTFGFEITPSVEQTNEVTEFERPFTGLKTAQINAILSRDATGNTVDYISMPETVTLGKWDLLDFDEQKICRRTNVVESEVAFTDEEISGFGECIVSADRKVVAYKADVYTNESIAVPTTYAAHTGGTEQIEGNGMAVTVTQTYLTPKGAQ